jgi:hypothetical protein
VGRKRVSRKKADDGPPAHFENGRPAHGVRFATAADIEARERAPLTLEPGSVGDVPLWWGHPLEELDLSPWLLGRLTQWQRDFDENFDRSQDQWLSQDARERWKLEGDRLMIELRDAVPDVIEVASNLWPLEAPGH